MSALDPADWIHLPYFLEAARCGSFTAAARRLNSSQPTVGRHVEALEARLGTALFRRVAHGVVLTPAGTQVLGVAEEIERLAGFQHAYPRIALEMLCSNEVPDVSRLEAAYRVHLAPLDALPPPERTVRGTVAVEAERRSWIAEAWRPAMSAFIRESGVS